MATATVLWFDSKAGCGLIKPNGDRSEIFARFIPKRTRKKERETIILATGDRVTYELVAREAIIQSKC